MSPFLYLFSYLRLRWQQYPPTPTSRPSLAMSLILYPLSIIRCNAMRPGAVTKEAEKVDLPDLCETVHAAAQSYTSQSVTLARRVLAWIGVHRYWQIIWFANRQHSNSNRKWLGSRNLDLDSQTGFCGDSKDKLVPIILSRLFKQFSEHKMATG